MIDAYAHCGSSKYEPVESLAATMALAGVERAVLCQHLGEYDNSYIEEVVRARPSTYAAVAMIDPADSQWPLALDRISSSESVRGIRLTSEMLVANPAVAWAAVRAQMVVVLYAPDGLGQVKEIIADLAASAPTAKLVITHLGCPVVRHGRTVTGWDVLDLAVVPGLLLTLSGMGMFCDYPYDALKPLIHAILQSFGTDRVMWGSNYPVLGDATAYLRELELVRSGSWGLSPADITLVTETTAAETFFRSDLPHGS